MARMSRFKHEVINGMLVHVTEQDTAPIAEIVKALDNITIMLLDGEKKADGTREKLYGKKEARLIGEGRGLVFAATLLTDYTEDEVRHQIMTRYEEGRGCYTEQ